MTKKNKPLHKITASLLNSWAYMFNCLPDYAEDALDSFIETLKRVKSPPNFYMQRGIDFEDACYRGEVPFINEIIEGGAFQVYGEKDIEVNGMRIRILGYLDVLKEGTIYDIKRVNDYDLQKYFYSYQHDIYFELIPEGKEFVYLVASGRNDSNITLYLEKYRRDERRNVVEIIEQFFKWLEDNDYMELYLQYWVIEE